MIPKIIHYCWFGGNPLPPLAEKCIASWRKFFPDYEIKRWDESNFDVNIIPYTAEAYKAKKYAFVSDYARFYILYKYGGLYFDTDVEVIRSMDDIIARGPFMGCERYLKDGIQKYNSNTNIGLGVNPGLGLGVAPGLGLGVAPGLGLYKELLDFYGKLHFERDTNGTPLHTVVDITSNLLHEKGFKDIEEIQLVDGVYIYPAEYFNPMSVVTKRMRITKNTRSIHHYMASWKPVTFTDKVKAFLRPLIPEKLLLLWNKR
jgi:mannosyltransferase OCH1-like enzyme